VSYIFVFEKMKIEDLSTLNAILNFTSFILLLIGYRHIKAGRRELHKKFMSAAFITSGFFLISYLIYHANVGSVAFQGRGWSRPVYFVILISHIILAAVVPPMAILTLYRGLKGTFDLHKKISKKTFVIWLYVSITGVVVYLMLYQVFTKL
jgi:putative membrane protein